ncbi:MAG TPA: type II toxin-antitoxin system VapC family toxin [Candidatus Polarisedimenticolaceae bacterium]|nr:type II toxin-antitoxin system VapC family toxin [Candidatus Polarisedimenticolaceae bacterium]
MRFWDASALVALLVDEPGTGKLLELYREDPAVLAWWGSLVECASAVARLEREGELEGGAVAQAFERLAAMSAAWHEIQPTDELREAAVRFLRVHPLRAADALQLAAAFTAAERRPSSLAFVCMDEKLLAAAQREGFTIALLAG